MGLKLNGKRWLRRCLLKAGYDISMVSTRVHSPPRRWQLLDGVDLVLDIGANTGQFATGLRVDLDYQRRIVSFEPLSSAYSRLQADAAGDPNWEVHNIALGDCAMQREINIAGNSYSSSLLEMLPAHLKSAPQSQYVGKETIEIRTLDSLFDAVCKSASSVYMKIDTQGFECKVLEGAR